MSRKDPAAATRLAALWLAVRGDGCTRAPDFIYKHCCDRHDADYHTHADERGRPITRSQSDRRLRQCMADARNPSIITKHLLPWLYWFAVRAFGKKYWSRAKARD